MDCANFGLNTVVNAGTTRIAPTMFASNRTDSKRLMSAAKRRLLMKYQKMIKQLVVENL